MIYKKESYIHTSFDSNEEAELYYSLKNYLMSAGVWDSINIIQLHRYCKLQFAFIKLFNNNPSHYMCDKYASHLSKLEEELLLTPKSMLAYKKDIVLKKAKEQKINTI